MINFIPINFYGYTNVWELSITLFGYKPKYSIIYINEEI